MEEQQKIEKELMLKEIEELRKEKDKAFNIALEVRDELRKLEEKERRNNSDGDCQRIISEEELETWLAEGWEAKIVLPSGKIVVEKSNFVVQSY